MITTIYMLASRIDHCQHIDPLETVGMTYDPHKPGNWIVRDSKGKIVSRVIGQRPVPPIMTLSQLDNASIKASLTRADHKPTIRIFKDNDMVKPWVVRDIGGSVSHELSRHKSDLGARRALCKYLRILGRL